MTLKIQLFILLFTGVLCFAFGRYSTNAPPAVTTKTEVTQTKDKEKSKDTHTVTKIVRTKTPAGETKTETTIDTTTIAKTNEQVTKNTQAEVVSIPPKHNTLNVSLLGTYNFNHPEAPNYGLSVSKQVVGPITAGVFGLNNGTLGLSLGLNF